jgi:3-mercaptopyruvate sulfurtransferase SseA
MARAALFASILTAAEAATAQNEPDLSLAPRIPFGAFKKALEAKEILVVDVRDRTAYVNGHIPGSISVPLAQVEAQAATLRAAKKPIVTYCA